MWTIKINQTGFDSKLLWKMKAKNEGKIMVMGVGNMVKKSYIKKENCKENIKTTVPYL